MCGSQLPLTNDISYKPNSNSGWAQKRVQSMSKKQQMKLKYLKKINGEFMETKKKGLW